VRLWLDFCVVKNLAEVLVNGKSPGIVWKKPFYRADSPLLPSGLLGPVEILRLATG
jgi:hypothetical protein